jgi:8-oxo-dGTP pyrophosphatase MutT (NUDIX family)
MKMSYPAGGTVEVPRVDPELAAIVASALTDPVGVRTELLGGLRGGEARSGHLCINSWVLTPELDAVLLVKHPKLGWTIPGGHLDPGEHPLAGAARELREETGLELNALNEVPVAVLGSMMPATDAYNEHMHYCLSYVFIADSHLHLQEEEGQPVQWFSLSEEIPEGFFGDNWYVHSHVAALKQSR